MNSGKIICPSYGLHDFVANCSGFFFSFLHGEEVNHFLSFFLFVVSAMSFSCLLCSYFYFQNREVLSFHNSSYFCIMHIRNKFHYSLSRKSWFSLFALVMVAVEPAFVHIVKILAIYVCVNSLAHAHLLGHHEGMPTHCKLNLYYWAYSIGWCSRSRWRVDSSWASFGKTSCWCIDWEGMQFSFPHSIGCVWITTAARKRQFISLGLYILVLKCSGSLCMMLM